MTDAMTRGAAGSYLLQAAIAAVHGEAARAEDTDWPQIVALYSVLMRMSDNPMVALNHAVAVAMARGPAEGLALLEKLDHDPRIKDHYRLDAVRAHLLERSGEIAAALPCYEASAEKTASLPERNYLLVKIGRLRASQCANGGTTKPPRDRTMACIALSAQRTSDSSRTGRDAVQ